MEKAQWGIPILVARGSSGQLNLETGLDWIQRGRKAP